MVTIEEVIQWLKDGEEYDAATLLADCSLTFHYVTTYFDMSGEGEHDMYNVFIEAPRKAIRKAQANNNLIAKQIEDAIQDCTKALPSLIIEDVSWVPKLSDLPKGTADKDVEAKLSTIDSEHVKQVLQKALVRKNTGSINKRMSDRQYYSLRTGKNPYSKGIDLQMLLRLFRDLYMHFLEKDYFQEAFGYFCVDAKEVPGTLGSDIEARLFRTLRKNYLWPIQDKCLEYKEDDLFDIIEFLHDHVSQPIGEGYYHDFMDCGWHYSEFDKAAGQSEYRSQVNLLLRDYEDRYELSENGEILARGKEGLDSLLKATVPSTDAENVEARIHTAIRKFQRYGSTLEDRRDAVRDLADVLEYLRPQLQQVLTKKDESDLFNLANNFGVRHHNERQKTNYSKAIWYSWMFYYYLATIHAVVRLIDEQSSETGTTKG